MDANAGRVLSLALLLAALAGCSSFAAGSSSPLPPPAGAEWIDAEGGLALYSRVELPAGRGHPRGVVWLVLGPEIPSAPLYPRFLAALREGGFAVAVLHPRGTGYSPGLRGHVDDYRLFLSDFTRYAEVLSRRFPATPLFLMGHSAGAAFALEVAARSPVPVAGLVLVNPAFRLARAEGMSPSFGDYLAFAVNRAFRPSALTVDMNARPEAARDPGDRAEGLALQQDALVVRYFSMRTLAAQKEVMDACAGNAALVRAPLLLVQGRRDALVDPAGNEEILAASASPDRRRLVAESGGHGSSAVETMVEPLLGWLLAHSPGPGAAQESR